jgi:hypothetical protein
VSSSGSPLGIKLEEFLLLVSNGINEMPEDWSLGTSLNFGNVGCLPGLARIIVGIDVIVEGLTALDELSLLCL